MLQSFFLIGFIFIIVILLLPANTFTIPDEILTVVCIYLICSMAGFPIITILKIGCIRLLLNSELKIGEGKIYYNKAKEQICPNLEGIEERYVYQIDEIKAIKETCRYYYVYHQLR